MYLRLHFQRALACAQSTSSCSAIMSSLQPQALYCVLGDYAQVLSKVLRPLSGRYKYMYMFVILTISLLSFDVIYFDLS